MKTNKEVIDSLEKYFLKQDPKVVARAFAGTIIDINRLLDMDSLPYNEKVMLMARLKLNRQQLLKFVEDGPQGDLQLHNINSE